MDSPKKVVVPIAGLLMMTIAAAGLALGGGKEVLDSAGRNSAAPTAPDAGPQGAGPADDLAPPTRTETATFALG
jgi:hypothetical protein